MATVRVPTDFPTISAAMGSLLPLDTIILEPGYSNETATVTVNGLTINGTPSSTNITLLFGSSVDSIILTGAAPISVFDNSGASVITGNTGNNLIGISGGIDVIDGGAGDDRLLIDYRSATGSVVTQQLLTGTTDGNLGVITDVASLTRTVTFDNINSFEIRSGSGDDIITVGTGNDLVEGAAGADTIDGGTGSDTASYESSPTAVAIDLANGTASGGHAAGDTLTGFENVVGSGLADTLSGDAGSNALSGGAGNGPAMAAAMASAAAVAATCSKEVRAPTP